MIGRVNTTGTKDKRLPQEYELFAHAPSDTELDSVYALTNQIPIPISLREDGLLVYTSTLAAFIDRVAIRKVNEYYIAGESTRVCTITGGYGTPYIFGDDYFKYIYQTGQLFKININSGAATLVGTIANNSASLGAAAYDGTHIYALRHSHRELCKLKVSNQSLTTLRISTKEMNNLTYHDTYLYWTEGDTCYRMNNFNSQVESSPLDRMQPFVHDNRLWFLRGNIVHSDFNGQREKYRIGCNISRSVTHKLDGQWISPYGARLIRVPYLIAGKIQED